MLATRMEATQTSATDSEWSASRISRTARSFLQKSFSTRFSATALYVERGNPGGGSSYTHTPLHNGLLTDLAATIVAPEVRAIGIGRETYSAGDTITLQVDNVYTPDGTRMHWAIGAAEILQTIGPFAWVHWPRRIS